MTFTTPNEIKTGLQAALTEKFDTAADRALAHAHERLGIAQPRFAHRYPEWNRNPLIRYEFGQGWLQVGDKRVYANWWADAEINQGKVQQFIYEQTEHACKLLENRVNKNTNEGDVLTECNLCFVDGFIEGDVRGVTAQGDQFKITIRGVTNYRYGENAKNGVLTVYAQFRGKRLDAVTA
mgnify:CR=1 FL=1